jgi:GT2 family glycosyltransferase
MRPTVTVIIVNWNGGALLKECLLRLTNQSLPPNRIIVIDNASTDGSDKQAAQIPEITLRKLNRNTGFAFANNRALEVCNTDYVALLNPDAFAETDWLEKLIISAQAHPDVVAFGSRQLVHGKTDMLDGVGDIYHMSGLVWRNGSGRSQTSADLVAREIFSPCAGAALYSREALQQMGGFDEDFFCYVEDVDLGSRLRLAGYKSIYVPEAIVYHVGSASTGGSHSDFSIYHGHRNLVWTFIKNMPGILLWTLMPFHLLLNIVSILYFLFIGKGKVIITAKLDAIKGISSMWRKRRQIQKIRQASVRDIWNVLDKRMVPFR